MPKTTCKSVLSLAVISAIIVAFLVCALPLSAQEDPTFKEQKSEEGYVVNLKDLIKKSKQRIEKVDDKLKDQARYRRNQQREEKAREYFDRAQRFFDEGKFEKAQDYWKRAVKITEHPEMKDYIRISVKKTAKQDAALAEQENLRLKQLEIERGYSAKEVEEAYQNAVKLFKQKNFLEAQNQFRNVDDMFPDHKATRSYLKLISHEIETEQERLIQAKLKDDEVRKRQEKEDWKREIRQKENERQDVLKKRVNALYKEAVSLHKKGNYDEAKKKFKEVEWIQPSYKSTTKYLARIDRDIERSKDKQRKNELIAQEQMKEADRLGKIDEQEKQRLLKKKLKLQEDGNLKDEADFIYKSAMNLYRGKRYQEAREKFLEVKRLIGQYKSTDSYLRKVDRKIAKQRVEKNEKGELVLKGETETKPSQREIGERVESVEKVLAKNVSAEQRVVHEAELKRRKEFEGEAQEKYSQAIDAYQDQNFEEAKIKFIQVEAIYPSYKDTLKYLAKIDEDILKGKTYISKAAGKQPAVKISKSEKKVRKTSKRIKKINSSNVNETERVYRHALQLYRNKQYDRAKDQFLKVKEDAGDYKSVNKYLVKVEKKIASIENEKDILATKKMIKPEKNDSDSVGPKDVVTVAEIHYQKGLKLYKAKQFLAAKDKFLLAQKVVPSYKKSDHYLVTCNKEIEIQKQELKQLTKNEDRELLEWEIKRDERIAALKAKEEMLDELKGERYKEFKKMLEHEYEAIEKIEEERRRRDKQRRRELKRQLSKETDKAKAEELRMQRDENRQARHIKEKLQTKELEAKRQHNKQMKLDEQNRIEEQKRKAEQERLRIEKLKQEEIAKKEEAIRLKKEAELLAKQAKDAEENLITQNQLEEQRKINLKNNKSANSDEKLDNLKVAKAGKVDVITKEDYKRLKSEQQRVVQSAEYKKQLKKKKAQEARMKKELSKERKKIAKILENKDQKYRSSWNDDIKRVYDEGLKLYKDGDYAAAKAKFSMVEGMSPGYKLAGYYTNKLGGKLESEERRIKKQAEKALIKEKQLKAKEEARLKSLEEKKLKMAEELKLKKEGQLRKAEKLKQKEEERLKKEEAKKMVKVEGEDEVKPSTSKKSKKTEDGGLSEKNLKKSYETQNKKLAKQREKAEKEAEQKRKRLVRKSKSTQENAKAEIQSKEIKASIAEKKKSFEKKYSDIRKMVNAKKYDGSLNRINQTREDLVKSSLDTDFKDRLHLKLSKLEERAKNKKQELEEAQRQKKLAKKKDALNDAYQSSRRLVRNKNYEKASKQLEEIKVLLKSANFDSEYVQLMDKRINEQIEVIEGVKKKDEEKKKLAKQKLIKEKIEKVYQESISLYEANKISESKDKFKEFEVLLANGEFDDDYLKDIRKRIDADRARIEEAKKEEELKRKELVRKQEEAKKEAEMQRKELERKKEEAKLASKKRKLTAELNDMLKDAVNYRKQKNWELSENKFNAIDGFISNNDELKVEELSVFSSKLNREKNKFESKRLEDEQRLEKIAMEREKREELKRAQAEKRKKRELAELENKIKLEEMKLAKEKKLEEEKIARRKAAEEQRLQEIERKAELKRLNEKKRLARFEERTMADRKLKELRTDKGNVDIKEKISSLRKNKLEKDDVHIMNDRQLKQAEQRNKDELQKLVMERQREYDSERERIQKEYNQRLSNMYTKAINLYKDGLNAQAKKIFRAIYELDPNYKKTKSYMTKIDEDIKNIKQNSLNESLKIQSMKVKKANQVTQVKPKELPKKETRVDKIQQALDAIESRLQ